MAQTLEQPTRSLQDWVRCRSCGYLNYGKKLARNLDVCPECGWHAPLTSQQRLAALLDVGTIDLLEHYPADRDPLSFVDSVPYPHRIALARRATGLWEAVLCARGRVYGNRVVIAVMDFRFLGGSLGTAVGEMIICAAETALTEAMPLVIVSASGGARMQEGVLSLMQMANTGQALSQLRDAGILTISVVTDPTYGGVAASYATACDIIVAEPGARLGFAGPRVIEQTIGQRLPAGFQTAEFLFDHGMIDAVVPRSELRAVIGRLIGTCTTTGGLTASCLSTEDRHPQCRAGQHRAWVVTDPERLAVCEPWEVVQGARKLDRPTTVDYIGYLIEDFQELHGDRVSGECPAIVGGMGKLVGQGVVVIGHQKGHTAAELVARNFGMPSPAGYRKAARLMRLAAKLRLPVITLVDTPGAYPGIEAERNGQANAIAENIVLMAGLRAPVVSVIIGEGGSGGALGLAVADRVLMFSGATYSVISPEGCAAILWSDRAQAPRASQALRVDAPSLLRAGVVDGVVVEPEQGIGADHVAAADRLRAALLDQLDQLRSIDPEELVAQRRARFRRFGSTLASHVISLEA